MTADDGGRREGIFRVEGTALKIAVAAPTQTRPRDFEAQETMVFKQAPIEGLELILTGPVHADRPIFRFWARNNGTEAVPVAVPFTNDTKLRKPNRSLCLVSMPTLPPPFV